MNCPECGSKVTYQGFLKVECMGRDCPNYDKTLPSDKLPTTIEEWQAYLGGLYFPWDGMQCKLLNIASDHAVVRFTLPGYIEGVEVGIAPCFGDDFKKMNDAMTDYFRSNYGCP